MDQDRDRVEALLQERAEDLRRPTRRFVREPESSQTAAWAPADTAPDEEGAEPVPLVGDPRL